MYKLEDVYPYLLHSFQSEFELSEAIEQLSDNFTKNRHHLSDYLSEPEYVSAYTCFYFLTNLPKLSKVLSWLPSEYVENLKNCDLIDFGAGPGTFSHAWKILGFSGDIYQVETSPLMRLQAQKLWAGLRKEKIFQSERLPFDTKGPKLLLFGHSANEMGVEKVLKSIETLKPEFILFIEPGTSSFFEEMVMIRRELLLSHYHIHYPCLHQDDCPMKKNKDWCHQFLYVQHSSDIERLSQIVKKDRKRLPAIVQAFSLKKYMTVKEDESTIKGHLQFTRIVRVFPETKFSFEFQGCDQFSLKKLQVMKKNYDKEMLKKIENLVAGDMIQFHVIKEFSDFIRVQLDLS